MIFRTRSTEIDPAKLEIAAWDDHPNVVGHHRLFLALARALVKDHEVYQLLFSPVERPGHPGVAAPQALAGKCESGSTSGLLAGSRCSPTSQARKDRGVGSG